MPNKSIPPIADFIGGGPHVNPAVTVSMFTLGKCTYTDAFVRISAQLGGGLVAFPIFHAVANAMEWEPFGGPEFNMDKDDYATAVSLLLSAPIRWSLLCYRFPLIDSLSHCIVDHRFQLSESL